MSNLTPQGYELIVDRIVNRAIVPPAGLSMEQLQIWCSAYAKCQSDIIDLIIELKNNMPR